MDLHSFLILGSICAFAGPAVDLESAEAGDSGAKTAALWLFDEQVGLYPSCVLADSSANDHPLVLGPGGQVLKGRFGNALEPSLQPKVNYPEGPELLGLAGVEKMADRNVEPLFWSNALFSALSTSGENHL
jgi:hypothetical protein